jgi:hypothetical protein
MSMGGASVCYPHHERTEEEDDRSSLDGPKSKLAQ